MAVALQKRAMQKFQEMAERAAPIPAPVVLPPLSHPLPEMPISICMKGTLAGVPGTLVTLRGHSMAEIEARASEVRAGAARLAGLFDETPVSAETSTAVVSVPGCPDHGTPMKPSKFGGWYCPQVLGGDEFCKQKISAKKRPPFVLSVDVGMWHDQ